MLLFGLDPQLRSKYPIQRVEDGRGGGDYARHVFVDKVGGEILARAVLRFLGVRLQDRADVTGDSPKGCLIQS